MARSNESGHARNVARFNQLVELCETFGSVFNPSNPEMKMESLKAMLTQAEAMLDALNAAKTDADNATNKREKAFNAIKPLSTQIVNALVATGASHLTVADARTSKRKIHGKRKNPIPAPAAGETGQPTEPVFYNSVSRQSFDGLLENFAKLVKTVTHEPLYKPNEGHLAVETLTELVEKLRKINADAVTATITLGTVRAQRDKLFYGRETGLYDIAMATKKYVRSVFGITGIESKRIGKIAFVNFG